MMCAQILMLLSKVLDVMIAPDPIYYARTTLLSGAPSLFEIVMIIAGKVITTKFVDSTAVVLAWKPTGAAMAPLSTAKEFI